MARTIPDTEVLKRAGMQSVHTLLKLAQLRWTGHVTRMPEERLPKKILYGELEMGKRSHGGQKKWNQDTLKALLKDQHTNRVVGTNCTVQSKMAKPHQKRCYIWGNKASVKPSRNVHSAKPELRHHQQSCLALTSVIPSATDSLELELD